jgi:hypothetical protein
MGTNVGLEGPLAVMPVRSGHGDVHHLIVARTNSDSLTVTDYRRVFFLVTGHELTDEEVSVIADWFAEEDRL